MKNWVSNILTVQQYDMKLRDLETKYRTIPGERAKLREEYEAAKAELAAVRENAARLERAGKQAESDIAALNEKIRKNLTQSALVKKNAEYQALMADIENSKRQISELETRVIELMDEQENARKAVAEQEKMFAATQAEIREQLADFEQLIERIKQDALKLKAEKKGFITRVELNVLNAYQNILTRDKGKPVVPIVNGSCDNCSLKVTPQAINEAKKGLLVFCDNCSHILYDPDCEL
ncbi:MAG: hypothetical protein J5806_12840 [Lentisphaeria bacterium]|nr:hypothetical protein [Lentisphaeria bacterium]